jgi:heat shock protein HtpX
MKNQIKTIFLLGLLSAGLVALGAMIGRDAMYFFLLVALAMNIGSYFFSDKIVLAMNRAREVSREEAPGLHAIVDELAAAAQIPKPRVYIIDDPHANAFATGRNPKHGVVAVTTGILGLLNERELRGVLAHELSHVRNRDVLVASVAAAIATAISYLAHALQWSALLGGGSRDDDERGSPLAALALAIVAPIVAMFVQLGISRSREFLADEKGARLSGDPEALARALQKLHTRAERVPGHVAPATASLFIVNPFAGARGLAHLFSTHPDPEERIRRLLEMAGIRAA